MRGLEGLGSWLSVIGYWGQITGSGLAGTGGWEAWKLEGLGGWESGRLRTV